MFKYLINLNNISRPLKVFHSLTFFYVLKMFYNIIVASEKNASTPMLRKRQKQIFNYIKKFIKEKDYAPSFEEIRRHFRLASRSTVHYHIESLREKGVLKKIENQPRSIEINNKKRGSGLIAIPLLGTIAAGEPIETVKNIETTEVPLALLPNLNKEYFALKVKGDSMIDDGILDGDIIIAEKSETAENGDLVIALNEDHEATLKYFYKEKNRIRLEPRNPVYEPIYLKNVIIQGKFINLIRQNARQMYIKPGDQSNEREKLEEIYSPILKERFDYRQQVTYVPNKKIPVFNWFPYKEGFSRDLVIKILKEFNIKHKSWILDPFGGCGTTALACKHKGYNAVAVDILPIAVFVSEVKLRTKKDYNLNTLKRAIETLLNSRFEKPKTTLPNIPIINKAFPLNTQKELLFYKESITKIKDIKVRDFLLFGLLSILVDVSYTSKDGQYLRIVEKKIPPVCDVLKSKLGRMFKDLEENRKNEQSALFDKPLKNVGEGKTEIVLGDARKLKLPSNKFSAVITSPPYLNRYDYSRIYALELCLNFVKDAEDLKRIRHSLLRSHIEVKPSPNDHVKIPALAEILNNLEKKDLNNPRIPIMIKGYFEDMKLATEEMYRVCRKNATVALVIGNVRFEGEIIPVDLLLTEIAKSVGFTPLEVRVTRYKGNSSQQMGKYGRTPVRESIVIWGKI